MRSRLNHRSRVRWTAIAVAGVAVGGCVFDLPPVVRSDLGVDGSSDAGASRGGRTFEAGASREGGGADGAVAAGGPPSTGGGPAIPPGDASFESGVADAAMNDCGFGGLDAAQAPGPELVAGRFPSPPNVDGDGSEWAGRVRYRIADVCLDCTRQFPIPAVVDPSTPVTSDLLATVRVGWDDDYLYWLIEVIDDELVVGPVDVPGAEMIGEAAKQDAVELLLNFDRSIGGYGHDDRQLFYGLDGTLEWPNQEAVPDLPSRSAVRMGEGCYAMEIRIAWQYLAGGQPSDIGLGDAMALTVAVNDWDSPSDPGSDAEGMPQRQSQLFTKDPKDQYWTQVAGFGALRLGP